MIREVEHDFAATVLEDKDDRLSGRYLITYLRHVFSSESGEHKMMLTISKDAFNTQLPNSQSDTFKS